MTVVLAACGSALRDSGCDCESERDRYGYSYC